MQTPVDRGRDHEVAADLAEHGVRFDGREVGGIAVGQLFDWQQSKLGGVRLRLLGRRGVDRAGVHHGVEDDAGAAMRFIERSRRGEARRRLDQAGEHGGLGQGQLLDRRAKIALAGGLDAIGAGAEVDGIEIPGQDFVFGKPPLEPERENHFLELARPGALGGEEQVLRQLLRDRAAALDRAAGIEVRERGPGDAAQIHSRMLEEPPVLHGQNGVDQMARDLRQLDRSAQGHRRARRTRRRRTRSDRK